MHEVLGGFPLPAVWPRAVLWVTCATPRQEAEHADVRQLQRWWQCQEKVERDVACGREVNRPTGGQDVGRQRVRRSAQRAVTKPWLGFSSPTRWRQRC